MQSNIYVLRDLLKYHHGDQQDRSRPSREKHRIVWLSARTGFITIVPASVPGGHGAPVLASDKRCSSTGKGAPLEDPVSPGPLVPRNEMTNFIRKRRVCDRFAFGIGCNL